MLGENEDEDSDPARATLADDMMVRAAIITELLIVSSWKWQMIRGAGCFFRNGRSFTNITTDVGGCGVNGKDGQVLIHKD